MTRCDSRQVESQNDRSFPADGQMKQFKQAESQADSYFPIKWPDKTVSK